MKKTKRALFSSVVALILCFSMLVGTTFAWFTDEVRSGKNQIVAGNLDIELYWSDDAATWHRVDEKTNIFKENAKWEPGYTEVVYLKIVNEGSLALKYQLGINVADETGSVNVLGEDFKLSQHIRFGVVAGKKQFTNRNAALEAVDATATALNQAYTSDVAKLASKAEQIVTLVVYMPTSVGNEANHAKGAPIPTINLGIHLQATQVAGELDSFGDNYDEDAKFPMLEGGDVTLQVTTDANGLTTAAAQGSTDDGALTLAIPAGVKTTGSALTLKVDELTASGSNITLGNGEIQRSLDVHVAGVAADNTVPMTITIKEAMMPGLNIGNYKLYHVEADGTAEMTPVDTAAAFTAHNQFKYDPATGDVTLYMATFSEVALVADTVNAWEGNFDYSWYTNAVAPVDGESVTEYIIANADQLAAFGAIVGGMKKVIARNDDGSYTYDETADAIQDSFADKTIKLIADINLGDAEDTSNKLINNGVEKIFYPIGYWNNEGTYEKTGTDISSGFYAFEGTFDGNGHTISNFYQNTWEMKGDHNWYDATLQYYRDGMGLFGKVCGGTVKNLTVKNFSSDGEIATTGVIAAYADGATFENIAIFDCNPRVYNIGNGGIVGCVGWYAKEADLKTTFKNITVDNSNKISALWGSYDVACGGIVGQYYPTSGQSAANYPKNAGIEFVNCHVSAVMDVYNDVCANYQYYAYRYTGMLIGSVRENETIDGHSYPKMDGITAEDCTVHFGTWNDYYYCEIIDNTTASYTHDYQMSRLTEIKAIDGTTITYLDGTTGTVPASGRANYVIVDYSKGHGTENATCYHFKNGEVWTHDMGGIQTGIDENGDGQDDLKEDKQHIYLEFNNLVTGYGWGVTSKGLTDFAGVTNMDITQGDHEKSVEKFEGKVSELANNKEYKLGDIFSFVDNGVELIPGALTVTVTNKDESNPVSATIKYNRDSGDSWENSTIMLTGTGEVTITIQDYYFCTPTTIEVTVTDRQFEEKFDLVMNNGDFLHRVGNIGTVALDKLFKAKAGVTVGTVSVTIEAVDGTGVSGTYSNNAIQFSGTGVVKVTITDNDYCTPTELLLEVVDAVNATTATSATKNNVVLLNDAGFNSLEISGGYALYGNGFTLTCGSDSASLTFGQFVELDNGTLDNVQIVCPNYDYAALYNSQLTGQDNRSQTTDKTRYYNAKSAVLATGNSQILNSRISGGRAALYASNGNIVVDNSRLEGGAVATVIISAANSFVFRDVTLVQQPAVSTYDSNKTLMGMSVLYLCDADGNATPTTIEGGFVQYAWADSSCTAYMPEGTSSIASTVLSNTNYTHTINGKTCVNLGFAYMPNDGKTVNQPSNITDNRTEKVNIPYNYVSVSATVPVSGLNVTVSTYVYSYMNSSSTHDSFKTVAAYVPNKYSDIVTVTYSDTADGLTTGKSYGTDGWVYELNVDLDKLSGYTLDFSKLSMTVNGVAVTDYLVNGSTKPSSPVAVTAGGTTYTLSATVNGEECAVTLIVTGVETSKNAPQLIDQTGGIQITVDSVAWGEGKCVTRKADDGATNYTGAAPVLEGIVIRYWSVSGGKYVDLELSSLTPAKSTGLNGTNNYWEHTDPDGDFSLKITNTSYVHTSNKIYAMPVSYNDTMYFVASAANGLVSTGSGARELHMKYEFKDNNGGELVFEHMWQVAYNGSGALKYSDMTGIADGCLVEGTLITMADGTQKPVEDLKVGDMVMVFNHVTGKVEAMPLIFNTHADENEEKDYDVLYLKFSDGRELKIVQSHGLFDMTLMQYVYINYDNYQDYIGHEFYAMSSDGTGEKVELIDAFIKNEKVRIFCPVTYFHMNSFANGLLNTPNIPGDITGLVNYFEYDSDLKYNEEAMQRDIEKYGLYTYDDFSEYISEEAYNSSPSVYLKVAVGKGMITYEQIIDIILWLLEGSLIDN